MAKSAWAKFTTYISLHGGLMIGSLDDDNSFTKMFRLLISEDEARLGLHVPNKPTSVRKIAESAKRPEEEIRPMLKHMSQKGVIFERITEKGECFYNITPFIPGFYEYVMTDPETKNMPEMAELFRDITVTGPLMRLVSSREGGLLKVTPVMHEVHAQKKVYSFEDVMTFINNAHRFSVAPCACRTAAKLVGKGCYHPIEDTCLEMDDTADYYIRTGRGREVTKEEAIQILIDTEKAGLVHTAFSVEGKDYSSFICNCCGCSCSGLRFLNALDGNAFSRSNFRAEINEDNCVACGECVKICPVNAVTLGTNFAGSDKEQAPDYKQARYHKMNKADEHWDFINERRTVSKFGTAPCKVACPAHISVQGYIQKASEGKYLEALEVIKKDNPLPAICGRICPHPCEEQCTRNTIDQSLAIDAIKMFIADKEMESENRFVPEIQNDYPNKAAIIGSGPAGLTAAYYLAEEGFKVTVFEKNEKPGGMLTLGIPAFRLEKKVIESEIEVLKDMGVSFVCNTEIGTDKTIGQLRDEGFEAFYLAIGAQSGAALGLEHEDLPNVMNGVTYLGLSNRGQDTGVSGRVIVVGGGNVAIDVARAAVRDHSTSVAMYCLESAEEMPAAKDEQIEAKEEGITINNGWGPKEILVRDGRACGIRFKKCLSVKDEKGNFNPSYDEEQTMDVEGDTILLAIGQRIDWGSLLKDENMELGRGGRVIVDPISFQTSKADIFAGGDVVTGPRFAIDAIAQGKQGAISISLLLRGRNLTDGRNGEYEMIDIRNISISMSGFNKTPRQHEPEVDHARAIHTFDDLRRGLTEEQILKESKRCLHCGRSVVDRDKCIGCGVCTHRCEFDAIHLTRVDDSKPADNFARWYGRVAKYTVQRGLNIATNPIRERLSQGKKDR